MSRSLSHTDPTAGRGGRGAPRGPAHPALPAGRPWRARAAPLAQDGGLRRRARPASAAAPRGPLPAAAPPQRPLRCGGRSAGQRTRRTAPRPSRCVRRRLRKRAPLRCPGGGAGRVRWRGARAEWQAAGPGVVAASGIGGLAGREEEEEEEGSRPRPRRGAMATTVTTQRGPVSAAGAAPPRGPLRAISCYRSPRQAGEARLGDPDGPARPLPAPLCERGSVSLTLPQLRPRRRGERKSPLIFSGLLRCGGGRSALSPGSPPAKRLWEREGEVPPNCAESLIRLSCPFFVQRPFQGGKCLHWTGANGLFLGSGAQLAVLAARRGTVGPLSLELPPESWNGASRVGCRRACWTRAEPS